MCARLLDLRRLAKRPSSASLSMRGSTDWLGAFIRKSSKRAHIYASLPRQWLHSATALVTAFFFAPSPRLFVEVHGCGGGKLDRGSRVGSFRFRSIPLNGITFQ